VVLRHQLAILRRGETRPHYTTTARALLAAASRLLPQERWSCLAVSPQTLRRWHRSLLQGRRQRRRRRPGRPPLAAATRSLIERMARENPRWGYMRIEGELLKLGIKVSATTIATVLRSSGLGPAPRRIGPSWSEFLRAQAHTMVGGGLSPAVGDDSLDSHPEPSALAQDGEPRPVEADDKFSPAATADPRLASHPLPARSRSALPRVLPATRGPLRPPPSHRSHARDGPQEQARTSSHSRMLRPQCQSHRRSRPASAPTTCRIASGGSEDLPPAASARRSDHHPSYHPNRVSLPHNPAAAVKHRSLDRSSV
jgi:transposase